MDSILITGGTGFVSGYLAEYYVEKGFTVTVLNRGNRPQPDDVRLIRADRRSIGSSLDGLRFDAVIDATAFDGPDVEALLPHIKGDPVYVLISSSAVYPDTATQPFTEDTPLGENRFWGEYGLGKIRAEKAAQALRPDAYILRPPYIYGPRQNVYREPFVFDCAMGGRPFCIPGEGLMPLQFTHIRDLARIIDRILLTRPEIRIFNVGEPEPVTVRQWVELCYSAAGKDCRLISVGEEHPQRSYFPFHPYAYQLDVARQQCLLDGDGLIPLEEGLKESLAWYLANPDQVNRRDYTGYIDERILK